MEKKKQVRKSKLVLYKSTIDYFIANDVVLYCPKSLANYFDVSYNYVLRQMDKLKNGIIELSNNVLMLSLEGAYKVISLLQAPIGRKRSAIREILNEDVIQIMCKDCQ